MAVSGFKSEINAHPVIVKENNKLLTPTKVERKPESIVWQFFLASGTAAPRVSATHVQTKKMACAKSIVVDGAVEMRMESGRVMNSGKRKRGGPWQDPGIYIWCLAMTEQ
jgi:hypothetical protein